MSTKRIVRIFAAITALSLLLTTAAYALSPGITTLENSNHDYRIDESGNYTGTDTVDYCLWAYDVQISLSALKKLMASGEAALKAELEQASQYSFLVRGSAYQPVTEGYETDISRIRAEVTDEGYPVTVTLPAITPGVVSAITYRVYVAADPYTPPEDYSGYLENGDVFIYYTNTLTVFASQWEAWGADNIQDAAITEMLRYEAVNRSSGKLVNAVCSAVISDYIMELPEYPATFTALATFTTENGENATGDILITVVEDPAPVLHTLTVRYVDEKGHEVKNAYTAQYQDGAEYDISNEVQLSISGYTRSGVEGSLTGVISSDTEVIVTYKKDAVPPPSPGDEGYSYYHVTVRYVDKDTEEELLEPYRSGSLLEGQSYDVSNQASAAIDGYAIAGISGETDGRITRDVVVTVYYLADKDDTGGTGQSGDAAAPITPEPSHSPYIPGTPAQGASSNRPVDTSPVSGKGTNGSAVEHTGDNADNCLSEVREVREAGIILARPPVTSVENVTRSQADNAVVKTTGSLKGGSILGLILSGLSGVTAAVLCGGIMSDIQVLRWYEARKRRVIRL